VSPNIERGSGQILGVEKHGRGKTQGGSWELEKVVLIHGTVSGAEEEIKAKN